MKKLSKINISIAAIIPPVVGVLLAASVCYFYYITIETVFKFAKLSLEISQTQESNIKLLDKVNYELGECKKDLEEIRNNVER